MMFVKGLSLSESDVGRLELREENHHSRLHGLVEIAVAHLHLRFLSVLVNSPSGLVQNPCFHSLVVFS